jgi:hypothetical protein
MRDDFGRGICAHGVDGQRSAVSVGGRRIPIVEASAWWNG